MPIRSLFLILDPWVVCSDPLHLGACCEGPTPRMAETSCSTMAPKCSCSSSQMRVLMASPPLSGVAANELA
ncbi:hypothetical protein Taro_008278 [Colocasia esculenta]|uniref:Secreted protein n=1 Tax=Colocasia esculenta TaxID=4460 RepID=A0A843TXT6_COLES|nr:hypothetical protein [Colocasia esculenta]